MSKLATISVVIYLYCYAATFALEGCLNDKNCQHFPKVLAPCQGPCTAADAHKFCRARDFDHAINWVYQIPHAVAYPIQLQDVTCSRKRTFP